MQHSDERYQGKVTNKATFSRQLWIGPARLVLLVRIALFFAPKTTIHAVVTCRTKLGHANTLKNAVMTMLREDTHVEK
jgi:hypothetical protein